MAKKKRQRRRPKGQSRDDEYFDADDQEPLPKGTAIIDEYVLRLIRQVNVRLKRSLFKDYGYRCTSCQWATTKTGINGRNAARAHSKKHKNDRGAENHLQSYAWTGIATLFLIALLGAWTTLDIEIPRIPTSWLGNSPFVGPALLVTSLISAYGLYLFQTFYSLNQSKQWEVGYRASLAFGGVVLVAEILLATGIPPIEVPVPWLASGAPSYMGTHSHKVQFWERKAAVLAP